MAVMTLILGLLSVILLLPCGVLMVQVVAASLPARGKALPKQGNQIIADCHPAAVCLLMPAHNEALGIAKVLNDLLPQLTRGVRLLVVADNCTDNTADIARSLSEQYPQLEVIERDNALLRGKGYALDHGVQHLADNPPQVVLVVDADCVLQPGTIGILVAACLFSGCPAQALYLMHAPPDAPVKTLVAEFAWLVKNKVRAAGFHRLGLPCPLMGTGMAFSWVQIRTAALASGHIVEDLQLGIELARRGTPPQFCPEALVTSYFPFSEEGHTTQRTRWEHGHLGVIVSEFPGLMKQALATANGPLLAMALDLCVPPLALLSLMVGALAFLGGVACTMTGLWVPLLLTCLPACALTVAVMLAWLAFGRKVITLGQLCSVPLYVLAKIPLYVGFLIRRQSKWVRAKRDGE
jgi:cellulose synthase/poly-beta-1,6-N-acetylglucosamine synthase-like glycosyltransferase